MEKFHALEDGQVIREIIPGGHEDRIFFRYPDTFSAQLVQKLKSNRFVPNIIAVLIDESVPDDGSALRKEGTISQSPPVVEEAVPPPLLHETIQDWSQQIPSPGVDRAA
ncbi:MAG TPA: hypothetical protein VFH99_01400 [Candidatus Saccharimonadales bacterium]|nr:hypothetical protein [Candidatus Saccharimonadales bacterium]